MRVAEERLEEAARRIAELSARQLPNFTSEHFEFAPGFAFWRSGNGWGDLEMVGLTEDLGRYFGTDKGLLVVRAPDDEDLKLRDGDVIQSIDGREPNSVAHAVRILGSYQAGETMEIEIVRDQRRQTPSILIPDNRQSGMAPVSPPGCAFANHRSKTRWNNRRKSPWQLSYDARPCNWPISTTTFRMT
ncbi:MAG: PDZ domain-containing protein [Woeseiaceae bacterium]|nr:PDZ domain-containing protein [Woeseiaceae bacterium]